MDKHFHKNGFTLIEMIISLVILSILSVLMSMGVSQIVKGYLFAKYNAQTTLMTQTAFTRLAKELSSIDQVAIGSRTAITYSFVKNGVSVPGRIVSWSGTPNTPLYLGGNILAGNVSDFELTYHTSYNDPGDNVWNGSEKIIGIRLDTIGASGIVSSFSINVVPRNL